MNMEGKSLIELISNNDSDKALELIKSGNFDPNEICSETGSTSLQIACENNMSEVALALINTGKSRPPHVNYSGYTALIICCEDDPEDDYYDMTEVALALINTGKSRPQQVNQFGFTALMICCNDSPDHDNWRPKDKSEVALAIINTGNCRLEQVDDFIGYTALMYACNNETIDIRVPLAIIATGKSMPEYEDEMGYTALLFACGSHRKDMSDVALALIGTGKARPEHLGDGCSALIMACENKMSDVALALALLATGPELEYEYGHKNAYDIALKNGMNKVVFVLQNMKKHLHH
jgi:ankyrin repeat protein